MGSHEILVDDDAAVRLACRAADQGFAALLDDADRALNSAAAFLERTWAG